MPGVTVTTSVGGGSQVPLRPASGQYFVVGLTERGSTDRPILVRGMSDVTRELGARVSYGQVWDSLNSFFGEGGDQAWVSRVAGQNAVAGTLTLMDRAQTPVQTLRIDAANPGSWSSQMQIEVQDGSLPNTFRIRVFLNGDLVEDRTNLASPADAVQQFSASQYISVTDLGSASAAPTNNPNAAVATALSAGSDDRTNIQDTDWTGALNRFSEDLEDGAVAMPGQISAAMWQAMVDHCKANNRIALLSAAMSATKNDLQTRVNDVDSEYAGLFAPWIVVSDGSTGIRTIPPEGFVAGVRARAHKSIGAWAVPAGELGVSKLITDLDVRFNTSDANDLDAAKVNIIRNIANSFRLYGWRSMSSDQADYAYLYTRDLLNRLVVDGSGRLEQYVFKTIDSKGQLLSAINSEIVGMVDPIRLAGGLYEKYDSSNQLIDPGYLVDTSAVVNSDATLSQNTINVLLKVRISPVGAMIALTIVKVGVLNSF